MTPSTARMSHQIITQLEQVTPAWLTQVLKEQGYLKQGRVIDLQEVSRYDETPHLLDDPYLIRKATKDYSCPSPA